MPLSRAHRSSALLHSRVIGQGLVHAKPGGVLLIRRADNGEYNVIATITTRLFDQPFESEYSEGLLCFDLR